VEWVEHEQLEVNNVSRVRSDVAREERAIVTNSDLERLPSRKRGREKLDGEEDKGKEFHSCRKSFNTRTERVFVR